MRPRRGLLLLFLLALVLRAAYILEIGDLPTLRYLVMDAHRHDLLAARILEGAWLPPTAFDQAPLYPYFLAATYALTGHSYGAVRAVQAVADAVTVVLLATIGRRLFGPASGLAAGLLAAFYGPMVFHTALLLKATLVLLAVAVFLLLRFRAVTARRWRLHLMAAGAALGGAALLRENLLLLAPAAAVLVAVWPPRPGGRRQRAEAAAVLLLGAAAALAPSVLLNWRASGTPFVTSSQGGMNFLIGNEPGGRGTYRPLYAGSQHPEQERADARRLAAEILTAERGRPVAAAELSPGVVSRTLWREGLRAIARRPGSWLRLMARKTGLFFNVYEMPDAEGFDLYRGRSAALRLAVVDFAWIVPLAAAGLALAWRRREARELAIAAGVVGASVVAFFVFARYRLPVVPFLLPLAGLAAVELPHRLLARRWRSLAGPLLAAGAGLLLVHLPLVTAAERAEHRAMLHYNLGAAGLRETADLDRVMREAAGRGVAAAELSRLLGRALGASAAAARELETAVALRPDFLPARIGWAAALHRRGIFLALSSREDEAAAAFDEALAALAPALAAAPEAGRADHRRKEEAELRRQATELAGDVAASAARLWNRRGVERLSSPSTTRSGVTGH